MLQLLWKTECKFPPKLNVEPSYDPAILLLDIYPKQSESQTYEPMVTAALFKIAEMRKELKCALTDEWIQQV